MNTKRSVACFRDLGQGFARRPNVLIVKPLATFLYDSHERGSVFARNRTTGANLVLERIQKLSVLLQTPVQMRARGSSGGAHVPDDPPLLDLDAYLDARTEPREVSVVGGESFPVIDADQIPICPAFARACDLAGGA